MRKFLKITAIIALTIAFTACTVAEPAEQDTADTSMPATDVTQQQEEPTPTEAQQSEEATPTETPQGEEPTTVEPMADTILAGMQSFSIFGEEVTGQYFADNDITLVNVWATWCPPCIAEMPTLATLEKQYRDQGFGVLGVVTDLTGQDGMLDEGALEEAHVIAQASEVEFANVVVDMALYEAILPTVQAFPTSFFVDSDGNVLGEGIVGAKTEQEWAELIDEQLASQEG